MFRAIAHTPAAWNPDSATTVAMMESYAFIFPGQGSQAAGMGQSLAAASPAAAGVFVEADELLENG